MYGYADSAAYAGYFDGRIKVTRTITCDDGAYIDYNSSFGRALTVFNGNSNGTSFRARVY